jgi:hypothetical protein
MYNAQSKDPALHRKKILTSFPSPAGISLTKLLLGRNNSVMTSLFLPRESLVVTSRMGTRNSRTFFLRCTKITDSMCRLFILPQQHQNNNRTASPYQQNYIFISLFHPRGTFMDSENLLKTVIFYLYLFISSRQGTMGTTLFHFRLFQSISEPIPSTAIYSI